MCEVSCWQKKVVKIQFSAQQKKIILTGVSVSPEYVRFEELTFYCARQTFDLALQSVMDVAYIH